jgi:hypothetical protein
MYSIDPRRQLSELSKFDFIVKRIWDFRLSGGLYRFLGFLSTATWSDRSCADDGICKQLHSLALRIVLVCPLGDGVEQAVVSPAAI